MAIFYFVDEFIVKLEAIFQIFLTKNSFMTYMQYKYVLVQPNAKLKLISLTKQRTFY